MWPVWRQYHRPPPRLHETGGKFGNRIITATYESGDVIDIEIKLSTNHWGFFEIKLCPVVGDSETTSECFDQFPLSIWVLCTFK